MDALFTVKAAATGAAVFVGATVGGVVGEGTTVVGTGVGTAFVGVRVKVGRAARAARVGVGVGSFFADPPHAAPANATTSRVIRVHVRECILLRSSFASFLMCVT